MGVDKWPVLILIGAAGLFFAIFSLAFSARTAAVAALVEDIDGDGVPEVLLGRVDGFVNVLRLSDGRLLGLLSTGQPIVGMAILKNHDGKPCLAVGTRMGVHLFGSDLKPIGSQPMPVAAFAGPGGKKRDRAYVVDSAGQVTVLILK